MRVFILEFSPPPLGPGNTTGLLTKNPGFLLFQLCLQNNRFTILHYGENAWIDDPLQYPNSDHVKANVLTIEKPGDNCFVPSIFLMNYHFGSWMRSCSAQS